MSAPNSLPLLPASCNITMVVPLLVSGPWPGNVAAPRWCTSVARPSVCRYLRGKSPPSAVIADTVVDLLVEIPVGIVVADPVTVARPKGGCRSICSRSDAQVRDETGRDTTYPPSATVCPMTFLQRHPGALPGAVGLCLFVVIVLLASRTPDASGTTPAAGTGPTSTRTVVELPTSPEGNPTSTATPTTTRLDLTIPASNGMETTVAPTAPTSTVLIRELPRPGELPDGVIATGVPDEVLSVVDVRADDTLNLRTGPGTEFEIVGELSPNATGIIATQARKGWELGWHAIALPKGGT